jgi:hypothetical protein
VAVATGKTGFELGDRLFFFCLFLLYHARSENAVTKPAHKAMKTVREKGRIMNVNGCFVEEAGKRKAEPSGGKKKEFRTGSKCIS